MVMLGLTIEESLRPSYTWTRSRGGWIVASTAGALIAAGQFTARATCSLHIELLALLAALMELKSKDASNVILYTDCGNALEAINAGKYITSAIEPLVLTCRDHLRTLDGLRLRYTSRRANTCADWLAKAARISAVDGYWDCVFPSILSSLLSNDLHGMVDLIVEAAIPMLKSWETRVENEGGTAELVIDEDLTSFSADVISKTCFGSNYSKGKEIFSRLRQLQKATSKQGLVFGIPGSRYLPTTNNREIWRLDKEIRTLILNTVEERRAIPSTMLKKDLLQSIIEEAGAGPGMADEFIVSNCKSIYFAGHETTSLSAAWCLMFLGSHPEWQDRARDEVLEVCQGRMPDANMLRNMKVLTMVIQETLRCYSPSAFVKREALRDMKLGDILIPKGITLQIPISDLHHNRDIWGPDADEFNPERFAGGAVGACKLPHMYMPFGVGARKCAGQNFAMVELKIIISLILSKFNFSLSPRYIHSPAFALTIGPKFGVPLILKKA